MKKYIKPSIEVTNIKTPTLTATSLVDIYNDTRAQHNNFTFGSKGTWDSCWDDGDLKMEE